MTERKINIMPGPLAMKIAAGEVIERPASVVKELIENSIDARGADISIFIHEGGRKAIRVVDDGEGMTRDDAVVAFERHATSKLLREEDLYSIGTMGFRGEALPSIASVSDVILTTRIAGETAGTTVRIKGGKIEDLSDAGCAAGTSVEVRDIFFNTPVRLKFMRSIATETGHISDAVKRLALAHPSIRFSLYHNNGLVLESKKADLKVRVSDIFGRDILKDIIPLEGGDGEVGVHGFISKPDAASQKGLFIYVNGRWIRDRGINHAVANGYRNVLSDDRYPFVIMFITIPPLHVDVNVHPTKCEVRFKNPKGVYELVMGAVEAALSSNKIFHPSPLHRYNFASSGHEKGWNGEIIRERYGDSATGVGDATHHYDNVTQFETGSMAPEEAKPLFLSELKIVGQLWLEYLLCEMGDEFYIIDQHAAAERIAFERLKKDYYSKQLNSQMLLVPQTIELSMQEMDALDHFGNSINDLGFHVEPFGGNTFVIRGVPGMLSGDDCRHLIKELLNELASVDISFKIEGRIDDMLMRIACHSVIRGRRQLTVEEAKALVKGLSEADFSGNCPHGRPVVKAMDRFEIEKMFQRR